MHIQINAAGAFINGREVHWDKDRKTIRAMLHHAVFGGV